MAKIIIESIGKSSGGRFFIDPLGNSTFNKVIAEALVQHRLEAACESIFCADSIPRDLWRMPNKDITMKVIRNADANRFDYGIYYQKDPDAPIVEWPPDGLIEESLPPKPLVQAEERELTGSD